MNLPDSGKMGRRIIRGFGEMFKAEAFVEPLAAASTLEPAGRSGPPTASLAALFPEKRLVKPEG